LTNIWCIRAEFGTNTDRFVAGGYVAIDYKIGCDLSHVLTREELSHRYRAAHPDEHSNIVIGQQVGQLARFLLEMKAGDFVITPAANTELLCYGRLTAEPSYSFVEAPTDGCPYRHRRRAEWSKKHLKRADLSVPLQNTLRSSLTVFAISQRDEFFAAIGESALVSKPTVEDYDPHRFVLEQVLQLDDKEFEALIAELLAALGFEGSERTGKTGDGGVDATGELNVSNLAKVKVFVQAKRYKLGTKIAPNVVRQLRQAIPFGGQGAFITTADFQKGASDVALELGFPRIGLINGRQLVDLLVEHWGKISQEFRNQLGLRPGLVKA
jgi:predicted Mrr-cat superfamily restriction endonuclease